MKRNLTPHIGHWLGYGFAACFFCTGLYIFSVMAAKPVIESFQARNWHSSSITHMSAHLDNRYNQPTAKSRYTYEWEGQEYTSDRVFFDESVGIRKGYYRKIVKQLSKSTKIWVNPKNPGKSVIYHHVRWDKLLANLFFSSIFLFIGYGGLFYGKRQDTRESARREQYPQEPWKWPDKWQSDIYSNNTSSNILFAIAGTIFLNVWGLALLYGTLQGLQEGRSLLSLLNLIVTTFGFAAIYGIYEIYKNHRRFGRMAFHLKTSPAFIGENLAGIFMLDKAMPQKSELVATLTCRQLDRTQDQDSAHSDRILWQDTQIVSANTATQGKKFSLPINFSIPPDLPQSGEIAEKIEVKWEMNFKSKAFGHQRQKYILPVLNESKR